MGYRVDGSSDIEHSFVGLPSGIKIYSDSEGRFQVRGLVPGLMYAFGTKIGMAHVTCIEGVSTKAGQTLEIGDIRARKNLHEKPSKFELSNATAMARAK